MKNVQSVLWENISREALKPSLKDKVFQLKRWPNFGLSDYKPEFVVICGHLSVKHLSKFELRRRTGLREDVIDYFLNKASLLDLLEVKPMLAGMEGGRKTRISSFTGKLKSMFFPKSMATTENQKNAQQGVRIHVDRLKLIRNKSRI